MFPVCRCRTGNEDSCYCNTESHHQTIPACTGASSLLGCCSGVYCSSTAGCCSSTCCCCCCFRRRCNNTRRWWSTGSHPTESLGEQNCVSSGYWLCVSRGPNAAVPRNPDRKETTKHQQLTKKFTSAYGHAPFTMGQHMGPGPSKPARQIHGLAHVIVLPTHMEPVSHGPRCHVMGRAGPGRSFKKCDGLVWTAAHRLKI